MEAQTTHDQPGEVLGHPAAIAELQAVHNLAGHALEGQRGVDPARADL